MEKIFFLKSRETQGEFIERVNQELAKGGSVKTMSSCKDRYDLYVYIVIEYPDGNSNHK